MTLPAPPLSAADSVAGESLLLTGFNADSPDLGWYVVNDNVMGGRSDGDFKQEPGQLRFSGRTNTRGGGFSSIRTKPLQLDLANQAGIQLHVKGDGRRYTWRLTTDARWRGRSISYWADFETRDDAWSTVDIPFSRFIPQFRGVQLDGPALDPGQITGMGLMIYDKQDGPFTLRLKSVHAYSTQAPFKLEQYEWENRVMVIGAPDKTNIDLQQQQKALASGGDDFTERDLVLVTLLENGVSTAGDRQLSPVETTAARAALAIRSGSFAVRLIGKDGSVKLSGESVTPMTEIYALIDSMPMRQREKSER